MPFGEAVEWDTGSWDVGPAAANEAAPRTVLGFARTEDLVSDLAGTAAEGQESGNEAGGGFVGSDIHERTALEPEAGRRLEVCRPFPMAFRWSEPI